MGDRPVDVQLSLEQTDPDMLQSLHNWLCNESELRGRIAAVDRTPRPGEMSGFSDVLVVALSSGGALSVLAASLRAWFAQPRRAKVTINVKTANGATISVDADRVTRPEEIVREVLDRAGNMP
jgi:membrane-associated two-gene conflict system component 1 (EACC1)